MGNATMDQKMQPVIRAPLKLPIRVHRETIEEYEQQRGRPGYGAFMVKKGNMVIIEDEKSETGGEALCKP